MKKIYKLLALSLLTLTGYNANAQAGDYSFAATSGTFVPITGGTDVDDIEGDSKLSSDITIGFTFNFEGTDYTTLKAASDGFLTFGSYTSGFNAGNNLTTGTASRRPLVAPLWDDLDGLAVGNVSVASYEVTGTAPNRVFTFEWLNWEWRYNSSDPVVSFQVKLYETTNVVQFIYRGESGTPNTPTASIGLSGASSFLSLDGTGTAPLASNSSETTSLSDVPADGQTYTFTPPTCPGPSNVTLANLVYNSTDVDWTTGGAANWNLEYGPAGFTPGTGTSVVNTPKPATITGLTAETSYDVYIQDSCGTGDVSNWVKYNFTSAESCPAPSDLTFTSNGTSADVDWTTGGASNWNIEYGPDGFTRGTGTSIVNASKPATIPGLTPTTDYDIYVQDSCGTGDVSTWVKLNLTTPCASIIPPYLQDFSSFVPTCWDEAGNGTPITGPTGLGFADWAKGLFLNSGSNDAARINLYSNSDKEWLFTPSFDLSGTNLWELTYDAGVTDYYGSVYSDMGSDDEVILLITEDNGTTWDTLEIFNAANNPSNLGTNKVYNLSAYSGTVKFAFWATDGSTSDSEDYYFFVDNFDIHVLPACPVPTALNLIGLAYDSTNLDWTTGGASNWNIEYGPAGFTPGTGTAMINTSKPATILGLTPFTEYDVYVQDSCGTGNVSDWVMINFTTPVTCPAPTGLAVSSVSDTAATFTWVSGGANNANLEFGPAGFTPGTGTILVDAFNGLTIDTLMANTDYEFYVQDSCGMGDVSEWTAAFGFSTNCSIYSIPWVESFENIGSAGDIPDCTLETGDFFTSTSSSTDNMVPRTGTNYLSTYWSADDRFYTVPVALTAGVMYEFSTWVITDGSPNWDVTLNVGTDQTAAGVTANLSTYTDLGNETYVELKGYYEATTTGTYYFSIHVEAPFAPFVVTFDDFKVDLAPSCLPITNITSSFASSDSVAIDWDAGASETAWNIEYGVTGFTQGSGTIVATTVTTDTISGLDLGAFYDFYVQADCGAGDESEWFGPFSVGTQITNDNSCDPILVMPDTDYLPRLFSNVNATTEADESSALEGFRTHQNTVWFKTVVPESGHLLITTCGTDFNSVVGLYAADTAICDSLETFGEIAYGSYSSFCNNSSSGLIRLCGETPGDTLIFYVGGSSSTQEGTIQLTVSDLGAEVFAGEIIQDSVTACAGDTLNLSDYIVIPETAFGEWEYLSNNSAIVNDTLLNTGAMTLVGNEVHYITSAYCDSDTATVIVSAATESNTGMAVANFQACSNGDVFLFDALTGTVDAGGTWTTSTSAPFNGNKFIANGLPDGPYQFTYTVGNGVCPPSSTQTVVNLVNCTSINEDESTTFGVYPNPNDGTFFISNGNLESNIVMEVLDVQGKVIYNNTFVMGAGSQQEISLGNVESGVYLVRVITNNQVFNSNVVVK